jgi:hypothetical protein
MKDIILYEHRCSLCKWRWNSEKRADPCPSCDQHNIAMSSHLKGCYDDGGIYHNRQKKINRGSRKHGRAEKRRAS